MRSWLFTFFILSVLAGLVGFTNLASKIAQFSETIFLASAILCGATLIFYLFKKSNLLLGWALIFLAVAVVSGILAYTQLTELVVYISKISFYLFLALFILTLIIRKIRKRT
jgi:uncharacterized membrane protein YtjA (UPF0391 family)